MTNVFRLQSTQFHITEWMGGGREGDEFLKKLWCCVGGEWGQMFGLSTKLIITKGKLATVKRFVRANSSHPHITNPHRKIINVRFCTLVE